MNLFRKASLGVVSVALTMGGLTTITAVTAEAATPCAAENQAKGAAHNEAAHKAADYRKAQRKLKRARKAYRKHHTAANAKKVRKAKRAKNRAYRAYRSANARYASASAAADRCTAPTTPTASPAAPATPDQIFNQFITLLDTQALSQGAEQLASALRTAADTLSTSGLPIDQLKPIIEQVADAIEAGSADPTQIPAIAQQFADALQDGLDPSALTGLLSGGLDPAQLASLLEQLRAGADQTGLPIGNVITAIEAAAADFAAGRTPTDPQGLVTYILESIRHGAVGTPFEDPAAQLVDAVEGLLSTVLGGLLGGIPTIPGLPTLPGVPTAGR
jgi:uncharacterized protein YejL (UPF0352 family)